MQPYMSQQGWVETLRSAVQGHIMEHGIEPDFIMMSSDVAKHVFDEVKKNNKFSGFVKINGDMQPMTMMGIEIAQITGVNRVELACDLTTSKAKKSLGVV